MVDAQKSESPAATGLNAYKTTSAHILPAVQKQGKTDSAAYLDLQQRFSKIGRKLTRIHRVRDGQFSYVVMRFGESRYFPHLHGARAYLKSVEATR